MTDTNWYCLGDSDEEDDGVNKMELDMQEDPNTATTTTRPIRLAAGGDHGGGGGAAPSLGGIARDDFDHVAGPLVDHFFPDGPPIADGSDSSGRAAWGGDSMAFSWPSSSSWHSTSPPLTSRRSTRLHSNNGTNDDSTSAIGVSSRRGTRKRRRRVAVMVDDARESLQRTLELRHGCSSEKQKQHNELGNDKDGSDCRLYLNSSQASAVVWTACEMLRLATMGSTSSSGTRHDDDNTDTALRSPLATHSNVRKLLRSIRIGDASASVVTNARGLHRAAVLRLASFLRPPRPCAGNGNNRSSNGSAQKLKKGGIGVGSSSTLDATKSLSTIVQFLHVLSFSNPPRTDTGDCRHYDDELPRLLFPILVSCCVHADTHPIVRVDACRWIWHALEWDRRNATVTFNSLRRVAQQVRLRLEHLMASLQETRPTKKARRDDSQYVSDGTRPVSDRIEERLALAAVLEAMATSDPSCQDLLLILPRVTANDGGRNRWNKFPHPQWKHDFERTRQGLPPAPSLPLRELRAQDRATRTCTPWLRRLKPNRSNETGKGTAVSSSWQSWLGLEDEESSRGRRSSSSLLLEMLGSRTLHHRLVLSSRRGREDDNGELSRFNMLLPFLLTDYASTLAPAPASAPFNEIAGHRLSRLTQARDDASVMIRGMNDLLAGLEGLALHTHQLPSAVQPFLEAHLLPNWDGEASLVPSIVSYWRPCSFDELYRRVLHKHIEPLLVHGDSELQYRIISRLLTPLVERWSRSILATSKEGQGATRQSGENGLSNRQVQALRDLIAWVDKTLIRLFVRSNGVDLSPTSNEDLLELASIRFFVAVGKMLHRIPALRRHALPSSQIVYRLLLSPSPFIVDRLCHLLASYRAKCPSVDETLHESQDHESEHSPSASDLNSYVSDAVWAIVPSSRGHSRPNRRENRVDPSPLFVEIAAMEVLQRVDAFLGSANVGFHAAAFIEILRDDVQQECSNKATERRRSRRVRAANGGLHRRGVEEHFLDRLRNRGFAGIHELASSSSTREPNGDV